MRGRRVNDNIETAADLSSQAGATVPVAAVDPLDARRWWRPRWWGWFLIGVVIVAIAAGAFIEVERARLVELGNPSPAQDARLASNSVTVSCALPGYVPGRGSASLIIDGNAVSPAELSLLPGLVETQASLLDGTHTALLEYTSANIFSRRLSRVWTFSVDTTAPVITVVSPASPAILAEKGTHFEVSINEQATVSLAVDGVPVALNANGSSATSIDGDVALSEGERSLLLTATDAVGNQSTKEWKAAWADYQAPVVTADSWPAGIDPWRETSAAVTFTVADSFPEELMVSATLDGGALPLDSSATPSSGERAYGIKTGELAEGSHQLVFIAQDRGGHATRWERT